MTQGSIWKGLVLYAIPIIISDFLQQMYSTVDSIIVGRFAGKIALAAVGQTFFLVNMFLGFFIGISLGITVSISRFFGARNREGLSKALDTGLKLTGILCVAFTILGVSTVPLLLKLVGCTEDAYADAKTYLTIYMAGISAQLMYNMLSGILKAIGDSQRPLYVLAFSASLNILLDYVMVGPLKMGVAGAAYATIISQVVSCVILWHMLRRTSEFEHPIIRRGKPEIGIIKGIFSIGLPYSVGRTVIAFSNTLLVSYVNAFGSDAMAGWSAYQKVDQFVISGILSLGAALTTFVAQNIGAGKPERIRSGVWVGLILTFIVSAAYACVIFIFRYQLVLLFSDDSAVVAFGVRMMECLVTVHVVNAIPQVLAGALRGMGKSMQVTIILTTCYVFIRQAYLILRWPYFHDPMIVVAVYHFTWTLCAVMMFVYYHIQQKKLNAAFMVK